MCEWNIACVLVIFCFSLNCELSLKCEVIRRTKTKTNKKNLRHGVFFVALCGLFNVVRYFVNDVT